MTSTALTLHDAERPRRISLQLDVEDPEVIAELERRHATDRSKFALTALRIGVLALRTAGGQLDGAAIREAGTKLVGDMKELLTEKAGEMTRELARSLQAYLDPRTGSLPQRLDALVRTDGELERLLQDHLGADGSTLAESLARHLGEQSPIFRMLSPSDANGLRSQLAQTLREALAEQRTAVVRQFSLDDKDSALSRLVAELEEHQGDLQADVREQVEKVVKEFSLDKQDSALSRLVGKVDAAQRAIADQFSMDNERSALSRMTKLLDATSKQISSNLTLDDERSALARLRRELKETLADLAKRNGEFQTEVRATLESMKARKEAEEKGTAHGAIFEDQLGSWLAAEAQRAGDVHEATGATTGKIPRCKVGDHVVTLGADSAAPDVRVVWEAKQDQGYTVKRALDEIEEARRNREAQLGVFVFSRRVAPEGLADFARHGSDFVIAWDPEEPATDLVLKVAYSAARALAIREAGGEEAHAAATEIDRAVRAIEARLKQLDEISTWATTIQSNGQKIYDNARKIRTAIEDELESLDQQVRALKDSAE
jgi:hypothetical protein